MSGVGALLYGAENGGSWLLADRAGEGEPVCQAADYLVNYIRLERMQVDLHIC